MFVKPRVKVLLSTYNGADWLDEQLDSIFNQSGVDVDLVIRDDGSSDQTISILRKRKAKQNFELSLGLNLGPGKSFFHLIKSESCEEFIALADQDDIWSAEKLIRATKQLAELKDIPALYCSNVQFISKDNWNTKVSNLPKPEIPMCFFQNSAMGCTIVLNKKAHEVIKMSSGRNMIMHDWYIFLIIMATGKVIFDTTPRIWYRLHENQFVGWRKNRKIRTMFSLQSLREIFRQSQSISEDYSSSLSPKAREFFERLENIGHSGLAQRVVLIFKGDFISRQDFYQDLWTKIRLLFL